MSPMLVVVMLSLMLGMQAVTTDLYLPALPALTQGFGAQMPQAQLTLTAMLLSFGLSQLAWGPLPDRWGRRPVLLVGVWAYTLTALGCTLAPTIEALIVMRCLQGVAMGAVVMCARAIVRDLYAPTEGARAMSKALTGLGIIACTSAPLGGVLAHHLGWRAVLSFLVVYGLVTSLLAQTRFRESIPQKNPGALQVRVLLQTWLAILRHPTFRAFALLSMGAFGALFSFLASSSFVYIQVLGLSKIAYGFVLFTISLAYILGTLLCRRLLLRLGIRQTIRVGASLSLSGGILVAVMVYSDLISVPSLLGPFYLIMIAHGIHQPIGQSGAVGPFPQAAGAASALSGFLMTVVAFAIGSWLGWRLDGTVFPLVEALLFWSLWIAAVGWTLVQRHGEPQGEPHGQS